MKSRNLMDMKAADDAQLGRLLMLMAAGLAATVFRRLSALLGKEAPDDSD